MALEPAFYGEMNEEGVIIREPQLCPISGTAVNTECPKWRVPGTRFFIRRSRMLRAVEPEALLEAVSDLMPKAAPARKAKSEDPISESANESEEDE